MGLYSLSEAERQRRSEHAKKMHAQGLLGSQAIARKASQRSAEVRARRASDLAARLVEQHGEKIEKAILAGLDSKNVGQKLKASELVLRMAISAEKIDTTQAKAVHEHMDRAALIELLASKLTSGPAGHLLAQRLQQTHPQAQDTEVVDGQAVELP